MLEHNIIPLSRINALRLQEVPIQYFSQSYRVTQFLLHTDPADHTV